MLMLFLLAFETILFRKIIQFPLTGGVNNQSWVRISKCYRLQFTALRNGGITIALRTGDF
jgi:hypothetical protein